MSDGRRFLRGGEMKELAVLQKGLDDEGLSVIVDE